MPSEPQALRLFVACPIPGDVIRALSAIQSDLRTAGFDRLRYVRPEGMHITLKFLGAVQPDRVAAITTKLSSAIQPLELRLSIERLGGFGGSRLRVVWAGLSGDLAVLASLAGQVEEALEPLGFPRENRPFAPHLTLARVRDEAAPDERSRHAAFVDAYKLPALPPILVTEVVLMRSNLGPGGAVYERLMTFPAEARETS